MYLECQVLQEVSCAIGLVCLSPRSGIDPDTNSRSLCPWRVLSSNLEKLASDIDSTSKSYSQSVG